MGELASAIQTVKPIEPEAGKRRVENERTDAYKQATSELFAKTESTAEELCSNTCRPDRQRVATRKPGHG